MATLSLPVPTDALPRLLAQLNGVLLGKTEVVELTLACFLAEGHLLLEDLPGVGKTTLALALARSLSATVQRVQFTADLLPSDILGTRVYRRHLETFEFVPGPIFTNFFLADELNRAPPKTQSALLQAMNENLVSIEKEAHPLARPFMVIATQNPRGYHGTYPLPESQRDRFMMRLSIGNPDPETELRILQGVADPERMAGLEAILTPEQVVELQAQVRRIDLPRPVAEYLVRLTQATRAHPQISIPASPRGSIALLRAGKALAFLRGKTHVDIDTLKTLAPLVLAHRMALHVGSPENRGEGVAPSWIQRELLDRVPVE